MSALRTLQPALVPAAEWLLGLGRSVDRALRVTSARRSFAEQARLYAAYKRGLSEFPVLPPGHSLHEKGRAFDMARPSVDPYADPLLAQLGEVWNALGGRWSHTDPVHFEV